MASASRVHTSSPTLTSLAILSSVQHTAPTGTWCSGVRLRAMSSSVMRLTKVASASGLASETKDTVSVVITPFAVVATMLSPSLSASMREAVPSAKVTMAEDGKHGLSSESPEDDEDEDEDDEEDEDESTFVSATDDIGPTAKGSVPVSQSADQVIAPLKVWPSTADPAEPVPTTGPYWMLVQVPAALVHVILRRRYARWFYRVRLSVG
mmetsp:Transcript_24450/g.48975  ORF Transcript_24450/g.48975 Transcript_24450/m.48975 type:complete len:209 (+) Transcript_24450:574-1200(+)